MPTRGVQAPTRAQPATRRALPALFWIVLALSAISLGAVLISASQGWLLYYGDAEAHLDIARRIIDSQTPGYDQIGTVWLPLPHWLMLPFVRVDTWWHSGIAGAIPSAGCFVLAGAFLFAAVRRLFASTPAAVAAAGLFALNPNLLYLQTTAMTEPVFFACLMALLYFTVRFQEMQGRGGDKTGDKAADNTGAGAAGMTDAITARSTSIATAAAAGLAACAACLTRYEGWFLLPFVAVYFFVAAKSFSKSRRVALALAFCAVAALGPLYVLAHHWWLTGDPLAFYRNSYSPRAIQHGATYPGLGDWRAAWLYYRTAAQLCAGPVLPLMAIAGVAAALVKRASWPMKRALWPLVFLALPGVFYIWSMRSSGATPIFVPTLPPQSYYNARYGLAVLPLFALASAALVALLPQRLRAAGAVFVIAAAAAPWLLHPAPANWVTWEEAHHNDAARRAWTRQVADYLAPRYGRGSGIISNSGVMIGIYREMGIPIREVFTIDNGLPWLAAVRRPELYLWQEWAVAEGGDPVQSAVNRLALRGPCYRLEESIIVKNAPVIEIYRRIGGACGTP